MAFDNAGLNFKNVTVAGKEATASNLAIILNKDGYASKTSAFGFVSSDDGDYKGYSYTMKLTDVNQQIRQLQKCGCLFLCAIMAPWF